MLRRKLNSVCVLVMLISASAGIAATHEHKAGSSAVGAIMTGIVRDAQGVVQMGAMIQVAASDSLSSATAFTDFHGRYFIANLLPGKYHVIASQALFVPALRDNLQLHSGGRTVVNLTLNSLFERSVWLPAERRRADEPGDDWKWTLRSAGNRPILRMVDDGELILISSSSTEAAKPYDMGKGSVSGGDGTFGHGGVHNTFSVDRGFDDGSDVRFRVDVGAGLAQGRNVAIGRPSTEIQTGYQWRLGFGGAARTVVSYQSHPEMVGTGHTSGLDGLHITSAQKMQFGEFAEVEVGSALSLIHNVDYVTSTRPFLRVTTHPSSDWTIGYRMATSRDLQGFNGLDSGQTDLPVAVRSHGHLRIERGIHQELSINRKVGRGMLQASYYRDNMTTVQVSGGGRLGSEELNGKEEQGSESTGILGVISDTSTGSFSMLARGYKTQGMNILFTQPLTSGIWAAIEYENGDALESIAPRTSDLVKIGSSLRSTAAHSATFALKGKLIRSNTSVRAAYRWQPVQLVTAVDPYAAFGDQAYLSFFVRQPVNCGRWLPAGLEATIDVTNLLAQGYRPFLSADGRTLFLAQAPRSIQAGLAFNF